MSGWTGGDRPDFASVNLSEPGADPLAAVLAGLGIAVEAGVWTAEDAERLAASSFGSDVIRILIEPRDDSPEAAVATAAQAEGALALHGLQAPRVHHGYGIATWQVIRAALLMGLDISGSRTRSCCRTARPRRETPSWSPPPPTSRPRPGSASCPPGS